MCTSTKFVLKLSHLQARDWAFVSSNHKLFEEVGIGRQKLNSQGVSLLLGQEQFSRECYGSNHYLHCSSSGGWEHWPQTGSGQDTGPLLES